MVLNYLYYEIIEMNSVKHWRDASSAQAVLGEARLNSALWWHLLV